MNHLPTSYAMEDSSNVDTVNLKNFIDPQRVKGPDKERHEINEKPHRRRKSDLTSTLALHPKNGLPDHQQKLRQVAYLSSTTDPNGFTQQDIEEILMSCRQFNSQHAVTGLLINHSTVSFQAIEGPPDNIAIVMKRIRTDKRHRGIIILFDKLISYRTFHNWSMLFRDRYYTARMEAWAIAQERYLLREISQLKTVVPYDNDAKEDTVDVENKMQALVRVYEKVILKDSDFEIRSFSSLSDI